MSNALPMPCPDRRGGRDAQDAGCPDQRGTLVATILGSSLAFVVGSIINVALPAMQDEFGTGATGAQWIVNAYLLPLGALVLIGGAAGDHYGRKRVFEAGLVVFTAACLLCAVAWSFPVLMIGRALEGIGAAMVAPTSLAIIADGFTGRARGQAIGTWAAAGAAAGAAAPLVGGLIVDVAGWRWAFAAVMPLSLYALWVARRSVRESRAARDDRAPLDWLGAGLIGAGLLALIWALIALPERGATPAVMAAGACGVVLVAAFLAVEYRKGDAAMTPLRLFGSATFSGLSLLTLFLYMALGGLLVLLPYVLIRDLGYGATAAGAAILPFPLILGLLSRAVGGVVTDRVGTRRILTVGSLLVGCGFLLFTRVPAEDVNYWRDILPALSVLALGMAACVAPLTSAVLASAGDRYSGVASGVNNAISRIAGLIATALLGVVLIGSADSLTAGFAAAAWAGAALSAASALSAWMLVDPETVAAS
ncbi:MFS transporter [Sulfitobacter sp. D35]|uniref:MFS transporter n=1 Tax=Sulfitobacter sp. D35 TaxID=3083252 RepID=UPI00296FA70B|nr:MFS transporter [Sulfitobacter sp. D35]MDW4499311.1 MFS transporter [Sulfitobacter sp. D35]